MRRSLPKVEICLNCGEAVQENFCPKCGQETTHRTTSLRPLVADLFAEVLSFDSKLVHTVAPLFFRPGQLTVDYNLGKRVRYLSPFKIYLFMSVVFFLLLTWQVSSTQSQSVHLNMPVVKGDAWKKSSGLKIGFSGTKMDAESLPPNVEAYDAWQKDSANTHKNTPLEQFVTRKTLRAIQNPQGFSGEFINSVPKAMFLLLPLFALLLKLIYIRSKRFYVEHLVFSLHVHAFTFGMLSLMLVPQLKAVTPLMMLWIAIYLFFAMKRVYGQGIFKTCIKISILGFSYLFLMVFSVIAAGLFAILSF